MSISLATALDDKVDQEDFLQFIHSVTRFDLQNSEIRYGICMASRCWNKLSVCVINSMGYFYVGLNTIFSQQAVINTPVGRLMFSFAFLLSHHFIFHVRFGNVE